LRLALALLLAPLAAQGGVVGQVSRGLLDAAGDLVGDSHPLGLPRTRAAYQPAGSATVRRRSSARRISRETCICETPTRSAISACVMSSTKRRCSTMRARAGSAGSVV